MLGLDGLPLGDGSCPEVPRWRFARRAELLGPYEGRGRAGAGTGDAGDAGDAGDGHSTGWASESGAATNTSMIPGELSSVVLLRQPWL